MQLDVQHDPEASRFHVPPEVIDGDIQHKMANMGTVLSYHQLGPKLLDFRSRRRRIKNGKRSFRRQNVPG